MQLTALMRCEVSCDFYNWITESTKNKSLFPVVLVHMFIKCNQAWQYEEKLKFTYVMSYTIRKACQSSTVIMDIFYLVQFPLARENTRILGQRTCRLLVLWRVLWVVTSRNLENVQSFRRNISRYAPPKRRSVSLRTKWCYLLTSARTQIQSTYLHLYSSVQLN